MARALATNTSLYDGLPPWVRAEMDSVPPGQVVQLTGTIYAKRNREDARLIDLWSSTDYPVTPENLR